MATREGVKEGSSPPLTPTPSSSRRAQAYFSTGAGAEGDAAKAVSSAATLPRAAAPALAGAEPPALPAREEPRGPLQEQLAMLQAQFESDLSELKRAYDLERERVIQTFGGSN